MIFLSLAARARSSTFLLLRKCPIFFLLFHLYYPYGSYGMKPRVYNDAVTLVMNLLKHARCLGVSSWPAYFFASKWRHMRKNVRPTTGKMTTKTHVTSKLRHCTCMPYYDSYKNLISQNKIKMFSIIFIQSHQLCIQTFINNNESIWGSMLGTLIDVILFARETCYDQSW